MLVRTIFFVHVIQVQSQLCAINRHQHKGAYIKLVQEKDTDRFVCE
jgi:hypothetical protein